jgi:hypothetical protein
MTLVPRIACRGLRCLEGRSAAITAKNVEVDEQALRGDKFHSRADRRRDAPRQALAAGRAFQDLSATLFEHRV